MSEFFVAPDAAGDLTIWQQDGDAPKAIVTEHEMADYPAFWAWLVERITAAQEDA